MIDEMIKDIICSTLTSTETKIALIKTLFLKTIEECKPKELGGHRDEYLRHYAGGFDTAISTYYDNLKRRINGSKD